MAVLANRRFLFWRRKADPVGPAATNPVVKPIVTTHDMESNTVVLWAQTWLIEFTDAILVRICQFCLMLGFIAGTIAVLSTRYNINAMPWFNIVWAVVQAIAIDGLFFAVWSIWQRSKGQGWLRVWYGLIGILLGCVAALVNDIVSYSELNRVSTIAQTMQQLRISESDFSLSRSILVVLVSILIVTLPRGTKVEQPVIAPIEQPQKEVEEVKPSIDFEKVLQAMVDMNQQTLQTVQEQNNQAMNVTIERVINVTMEVVREAVASLPMTSAVPQIEAPEPLVEPSEKEDESSIRGSEFEQSFGDKIEGLLKENPDLNGTQLAQMAGCSPRTARKWKGRLQIITPLEEA